MGDIAPRSFDAVVIGGGIAGMSAAWALARRGHRVAVVEREVSLTAHSTGRSVAQFLASYGGPTQRVLSAASRPFLENGVDGLADSELLEPRNVLSVAPAGLEQQLSEWIAANQTTGTPCELLDASGAIELCAALDPKWLEAAVIEYGGFDIDVAGLHQAFLRGARAHGAVVLREHGVRALARRDNCWHVDVGERVLRCTTVVNAAGAWADEVARIAGVQPVGLQPFRRTVFTFASRFDSAGWPLVVGADESFYFKPEGADQILASPADEDPMEPCDVKPGRSTWQLESKPSTGPRPSTCARSAPPGPACGRSPQTGCRSSASTPEPTGSSGAPGRAVPASRHPQLWPTSLLT